MAVHKEKEEELKGENLIKNEKQTEENKQNKYYYYTL